MPEPIRVSFPWHKEEAFRSGDTHWYRWRPGVRWDDCGGGDREPLADGMGAMLLAEVGRYTPPGYRERVFYTRQFVLPSGEVVGQPKLRVMASAGFTRLCKGYRYPVEVTNALDDVSMEPANATVEDMA